MSIDPKKLEGYVNAGTSTANPETEEELGQGNEVELNNSPTPTPKEEENANVENVENKTEVTPNPDATQDTVTETTTVNENAPEADPALNTQIDSVPEAEATKSFTQSQVDEIAGKVRKETRDKVYRDIFSRYGVNSAEELDELMSDAQRYGIARDEFAEKETAWKQADEARDQELISVKERVALLESGIDRNRFEDARLILRGKGLEVTSENIANELATHPEWKSQPAPVANSDLPFMKNPNPAPAPAPEGPATKIAIPTLGNNGNDTPSPEMTEREKAMKLFFK